MSNAKLASALLLSIAASVGLVAGPHSPARAADGCLSEPNAESPQGKHWYYRLERSTGRHCWYLRGKDEAAARAPAADTIAAAKPAPSMTSSAPPRSLADAHAEVAPRTRTEDAVSVPAPRSVWPGPSATIAAPGGSSAAAPTAAAKSQDGSPWPEASGAASIANATPAASPMVADTQADQAAEVPARAEPAQASSSQAREVGSLQKLALVAFGALALAGISGRLVYRLAGTRWRRRREERWPQRQAAPPSFAAEAGGAPWVAPELSPTVQHEHAPHEDLAPEDEAVDRIQFPKSGDNFEKIEDFLARLTRQLDDEAHTAHTSELEERR